MGVVGIHIKRNLLFWYRLRRDRDIENTYVHIRCRWKKIDDFFKEQEMRKNMTKIHLCGHIWRCQI